MTSFLTFELHYLLIGNPWSLLKLKVKFNLFSTQVPLYLFGPSKVGYLLSVLAFRRFLFLPSIPARDKDDVSFGEDWLTYSKWIGYSTEGREEFPPQPKQNKEKEDQERTTSID